LTLRISLPHVIRAVLIALAAGWIVAAFIGAWIARLQFGEISAAFSPDRVAVEYEARLDRELRQGPLLLLAQVGVMAGVLVWQVVATARHVADPRLHGAVSGLILALIQGVVAVIMQAPWIFVVPLVVALVGTGVYAGWSAIPQDKHDRLSEL
jgi:hypothetical protein